MFARKLLAFALIVLLVACSGSQSATTSTETIHTTPEAAPPPPPPPAPSAPATNLKKPMMALSEPAAPERPVYARQKFDPMIERLIQQMSLKHKIGQMTQLMVDMVLVGDTYNPKSPSEIDPQKMRRVVNEYGIGSLLNTPTNKLIDREEWRYILTELKKATDATELKIPILFGYDAIHGANYVKDATLFPQPLAMANTWNLDLARETAEICAYETRAAGVPWNFSPAMDIGRNPEWPRLWESFGEDVLMNSEFGEAVFRGYQGDDPSGPYTMGGCMKHFTGYGAALSGKDRTPAYIPERQLREYYLPQYQNAIDNGALSVMVNSGEINGIPAHVSKELLTDMLRGEMGFQGMIITDWNDIPYLPERHRVAVDFKDGVRQAIEAGIDMSMTPQDYRFPDALLELVQEGTIPEERIDESVRRILTFKKQLGLFDHFLHPADQYPKFASEEFKAKSREAAAESIVLAKNDVVNGKPVLPLVKSQRVLVVGPTSNSIRSLNGGWTYTWQGTGADELATPTALTVQEAIRMKAGDTNTVFQQALSPDGTTKDLPGATEAARRADVIVLCLGEQSYTEDQGNTNSLDLPDDQLELAEAMLATGKPVVLVMLQGRPTIIRRIADRVHATLLAFYPGNQGGNALADILYGTTNPSGALALTYPRHPATLVPYDHKGTEDRDVDNSGKSFDPQFQFGEGMSYTTFAMSDLSVGKSDTGISVSVQVKNTGRKKGKKVVPVYVADLVASVTPSVKRLRAFSKPELAPGEATTLKFDIPWDDLRFVGRSNQFILEPGTFRVMVGELSAEVSLEGMKK